MCGCDFWQSWFVGFASVCGFAGKVSDPRFKVGRSRFQGQEGQVSRSGGSGCRSGGSGSGFEVGRVKVLRSGGSRFGVRVRVGKFGVAVRTCRPPLPPPFRSSRLQNRKQTKPLITLKKTCPKRCSTLCGFSTSSTCKQMFYSSTLLMFFTP